MLNRVSDILTLPRLLLPQQSLLSNVSTRAIRSKDPASACIVDEGCEFVFSVIKSILGDEGAAQKFGVQDVAQVMRVNSEALMQVGASKVVYACMPTCLKQLCPQLPH